MNIYFVYAYCYNNTPGLTLKDKSRLPGTPFYIGYGKNDRHLAHLRDAANPKTKATLKIKILRKMISEGLLPNIHFIQVGLSRSEATDLEIKTIEEIGTRAIVNGVSKRGPLANMHSGGQGGYIVRSKECLARLSEKTKGRVISEDWKNNISKGKTGVKLSDTHKSNIRKGVTIALNAPGMHEKLSEAQRTKTWTAEHSKAASARAKSWDRTPAIRKKISESNTGNLHTVQTKVKISKNTIEAMSSESLRAQLRNSSKIRWSDPAERAKIGEKNAKSFKLTSRQSGDVTIITNMKNFCRENQIGEYWVRKEYIVEKI